MITVGALVPFLVGLGVPKKESEEEKTSGYWRLLFGFPIVISVI